MRPKLLLFDIGNTSIKAGLADGRRVLTSYTLRADAGQTADSLGLTLLSVLRHAAVDPAHIEACVASSVVPAFDPLLREAVTRYVERPLHRVPEDMPVPLDNQYERPGEVGADRLVGAFAARRLYARADSLIVVDFGTAVTFDCVSGQAYLGGLIFPGPLTAMTALSREAAKLPRVNLDVRALDPVMGRDTATSIRHGLVFGFVSMVEGLTQRLVCQLPGKTLVLGTGGFAESIARVSRVFDHVLPTLLLEGLRLLYYETRCNGLRENVNGCSEKN
jgi:type III pantothenate kinase